MLVVATGGAGGDLQPLLAAALALRDRGHEMVFVGDTSVARALAPLGVQTEVLDARLDLGPRLIAAIREAMERSGGDLAAAGPIVQARLGEWAADVAGVLREVIDRQDPGALVTSLFGVEALANLAPSCPWAVINSTFYVGPGAPRPLAADFGLRAIPLVERYRDLLGKATLVLQATDRVFDFDFDGLPEHHHYVGPLGIWEPPSTRPAHLDEPGQPWVLVTISSQVADDIPLAQAAIEALADRPVRTLVTVGPDHDPTELGPLPTNCVVERFVSHAAVLERGALLVSHAGHGSVMKALWHGRPMVLVPWGRDQPGVAARARALDVAEVVTREHASPASIGAAIDTVLGDPLYTDRAARASERLQLTDPAFEAADLLEQTLRDGVLPTSR